MCKGKSSKRGPDFSEGSMTGVVYLFMLVEFLVLILEKMGSDAMLLPQDGASLHFHKEVTGCLLRTFREKRTGRAGLTLDHLVRLIVLSIFVSGGGYIRDAP